MDFDPLEPHFYIEKLGFTGVYIIFLIFAQNINCGYSLEPPHLGGSNEYPLSMFWAEIWKNIRFFGLKTFCFWRWKFQLIKIGVFSKDRYYVITQNRFTDSSQMTVCITHLSQILWRMLCSTLSQKQEIQLIRSCMYIERRQHGYLDMNMITE